MTAQHVNSYKPLTGEYNASLTVRVHLLIKGKVQGVGFRWFARETAQRLDLSGWVRNLASGEVEAQAQGDKEKLKIFIGELKTGLPFARVEQIIEEELPEIAGQQRFDIH